MRVGWIGLGSMGAPMALRVLQAGHVVHGYARRPQEHGALRDAGGTVGDDATAAVAAAEIVCVNLFSEAQLDTVLIDSGAIGAMQPGTILAIHSTVSPAYVQALAARRSDLHVLDAGFSGGPAEAAAGRLTLMVGGDAAALQMARPVFAAYADPITHAGPIGTGMALKLINNLLFAANVASARDALRLVRDAGLDHAAAVATLQRGSAGSTALGFLGRSPDVAAAFGAISRYLDKDVPIALAGAAGLDLGTLGETTRCFQHG